MIPGRDTVETVTPRAAQPESPGNKYPASWFAGTGAASPSATRSDPCRFHLIALGGVGGGGQPQLSERSEHTSFRFSRSPPPNTPPVGLSGAEPGSVSWILHVDHVAAHELAAHRLEPLHHGSLQIAVFPLVHHEVEGQPVLVR